MKTASSARHSVSGRSFLTGINIRYSLSCMRSDESIRSLRLGRRRWQAAARPLAVTAAFLLLTQAASGQAPPATQQARVPTSYANVHETPSSGSVPLVLVPEGTVLPIIGRRGEWVQVRLSPELRQTGMVMRWYEGRHEIIRRGERITIGDEDSGWMHDSTVEISEVNVTESSR